MPVIHQEVTPENHYLLLSAADAIRKDESESIWVQNSLIFSTYYKGSIFLPNNLKIGGMLSIDRDNSEQFYPNNLRVETLEVCDKFINHLPGGLRITRSLKLFKVSDNFGKLPDDLYVGGCIRCCNDELCERLRRVNPEIAAEKFVNYVFY